MPPLIGITTTRTASSTPLPLNGVNEAYIRAVRNAGGLPVLIPVAHQAEDAAGLVESLDGLLFSGGGDMDPALFNGEPHPRVYDIDPDRDAIEMSLVRAAVARGKPFLGICRGFQVINVTLGGSLYTHTEDQMPGALKHDYFPGYPRELLAHPVKVDPASRLAKILGETEPQVNSLHHQGANLPAPGVLITAHAPDGLAEALELPDHPFGLAVQWHPEWLQHLPAMQALFAALVAAAQAARTSPR